MTSTVPVQLPLSKQPARISKTTSSVAIVAVKVRNHTVDPDKSVSAYNRDRRGYHSYRPTRQGSTDIRPTCFCDARLLSQAPPKGMRHRSSWQVSPGEQSRLLAVSRASPNSPGGWSHWVSSPVASSPASFVVPTGHATHVLSRTRWSALQISGKHAIPPFKRSVLHT